MIQSNLSAQPWGGMTYLANNTTPAPIVNGGATVVPAPVRRGGVPMDIRDISSPGRGRRTRAKFTADRRKEVQEIRKRGACVRCKILRKPCSNTTPCGTCDGVSNPRVWGKGCIRHRERTNLELYNAQIWVALAGQRISQVKEIYRLASNGVTVDASLFPETQLCMNLPVLVVAAEINGDATSTSHMIGQVAMLDGESQGVPATMELYMRQILDTLIENELSNFIRVTLVTATQYLAHASNELLRLAVDLWGLVEIMDRHASWVLTHKPAVEGDTQPEIIPGTTANQLIIWQLNAAAERKAKVTSEKLLSGFMRVLQDRKIKVGFESYLTALILLICIERTTWLFTAFTTPEMRVNWPLDKTDPIRDPAEFLDQGTELAHILSILLNIRRAFPATGKGNEGLLVTRSQDPQILGYFSQLHLDCKFPETFSASPQH
jgi:hypothetical protein